MNNKPVIQFSQNDLKKPPRDCNVTYSWTWNSHITKEGIDKRLTCISEAGVKSLYILPLPKEFRPNTLRTNLEPDYLSDDFFELVNYALKCANRLGIEAWIYDEGGWPSGGACGHTAKENPDAVVWNLYSREIMLKKGDDYSPGENAVAAFIGKNRLKPEFTAENDITVTEYYIKKWDINGNRVNNTSASVTDTFIKNTYERYKEYVGDMFGSDLPLIFTDEPGIFPMTLTKDILSEFEKEYGYDMHDYLYVLTDDGKNAVTEKEIQARIDYQRLLGKLSRDNMFGKLSEWCEKNGVYFSGHLDRDNVPNGAIQCGYFSHIDCLRKFHVPGIDVIWEQIRYPYGNRSPLDKESIQMKFFPRLASSAARQEGRNLAMTETFSIYGDGVTPEDIKYAMNYQIMQGINVFNFLTIPYGREGCSALMMRPAFCEEKPGFYNLKHINEYYARLSYLSRLGEAVGDTALFIPCRDYAANPEISAAAIKSFNECGCRLDDNNIPFDIIDEYGISDATVTDEGLKLGSAIYRHILVPENKYIPADIKSKIEKFIGYGEPIYTPKNSALKLMVRNLNNSKLWFVFNQSGETVTEALDISEGKKIYGINLNNGDMTLESEASPTLLPGDIAVYLITDKIYDTVSYDIEYSVDVEGFSPVSYERFIIDDNGIHREYGDGSPITDEGFSGEITYRATYELPFLPKADERYLIELTDTETTASIEIDGERICTLGLKPMTCEIAGSALNKSGIINVKVANTAANEIISKTPSVRYLTAPEYNTYMDKMLSFESRLPELKLGNVTIKKLK